MFKKSHFRRTFVKSTNDYSVSFKHLSKLQADILCHVLHSLSSRGVVLEYVNGITLPSLDLRASVPLAHGVGSTLVVPYSAISDIVVDLGNISFNKRDVLVDSKGFPLSSIGTYD